MLFHPEVSNTANLAVDAANSAPEQLLFKADPFPSSTAVLLLQGMPFFKSRNKQQMQLYLP